MYHAKLVFLTLSGRGPEIGSIGLGIKYAKAEVNGRITKLLIEDYGAIVATLARVFGLSSLEHVQRVCRNSFEKMRDRWGKDGIPHDPRKAVWTDIIDSSHKLFCKKINYLSKASGEGKRIDLSKFHLDFPETEEVARDQIRLLFALCSPRTKSPVRECLVLNILCGFSVSSLARIFERNEKALGELLASEKEKLTERNSLPRILPKTEGTDKNLEAATKTISEIFNLGQHGFRKRMSSVPSLCFAAIKLAETLLDFPETKKPATHALLSFMLLNASRLKTMNDGNGKPLGIKEQNRDLWDKDMIKKGFKHLSLSAEGGGEVSEIHLKAGVSAVHSLAKKYGDTNWDRIISLYDKYLACRHCPLVELQKAIAISKRQGPRKGLEAVMGIERVEELSSHNLLYSTLGKLNFELHKYEDAIVNFNRAVDLCESPFEKAFYSKKIKICEQRLDMSKRYRYGACL